MNKRWYYFFVGMMFATLLLMATSCKTAEWHYNKAIEKGLTLEPKEVEVMVYDTITKDSIVPRLIKVDCPEPIPPKTRWRTRFDNRRFNDSLKHVRRMYNDSLDNSLKILEEENDLLRDSLDAAVKMNKQDNRTERTTTRQENKRSWWWFWILVGAVGMRVAMYYFRRFRKIIFPEN